MSKIYWKKNTLILPFKFYAEFSQICESLKRDPKKWLITGVAGFIGSNILETLLKLEQEVVGLDNFSTGQLSNLNQVKDPLKQTLAKLYIS